MRILFIANRDPRKRYRFLLEPLREVGVDTELFDGSGAMPGTLFKAIGALRRAPPADLLILTGGDIRNFIWFLLATVSTRMKVVLRFGGDPLEVRNSAERGFLARRNWLNFLRSYVGKTLTQIMLKRVAGVVVVSDYLLGNMRSALGDDVATLVLPPTLSSPEPAEDDSNGVAEMSADVNLLTVTNLNYVEKAQGVITIAAAVERLRKQTVMPGAIHYDVVGGGYQFDFLQRSIAASEEMADAGIRLHGRSDQVADFYRRADIFVYCSTLDGYPLVLCEAQSYGLPIVANRWGAFPDMLSENEDALLFDADDTEGLVAKLAKLVEDKTLRSKMSRAARVGFSRKHSSSECGERLKQFLQSLI